MALFGKKNTKEDTVKEKNTASKKEVTAAAPKKEAKKEVKKAAKKTDKAPKQVKAKKPTSSTAGGTLTKTPMRILKSPRITEKAAKMTMQNAYVFEVAQDATKRDIVTVIKALYGVTPEKVNIVNRAPRAYISRARNRRGTKAGMKKAYIFLKKGDKIDLAA
jgi:large subunit ribosomal protein L23